MQEKKKGDGNNHLVIVLLALLALIVVAVFYWDRQQNRRVELSRAKIQTDLLGDWGPGAQRQGQSALQGQGQTVGLGKQVSYKNIIALVAPSVVSVNVDTGFLEQAAGQGPSQAQNVWGWPTGDLGLGRTCNAVCPNCKTKVRCQRGRPACFTNCPKCGTHMRPEGASWFCPFRSRGQLPSVQNQSTDQSLSSGGFAQYVFGGAGAVPPAIQQQFQAAGKGGSGVIVNRKGYVLTNHHVIHGAKEITVTVCSGLTTKTYPADVIDEAPELDFAILKIVSGGEVFIPAPIGNSSRVSVGDEVLAIGSPFGLQQSVTFGIISNTRRTMTVGNQTYTDFIQTDAALNPGSSGGALVNVNGEVIGINSAIYSPTQAFSGIGFARPIDSAKAAFPEFIDTSSNIARVLRRGILGLGGKGRIGQVQQVANKKQVFQPGILGLLPSGGWMHKSANEPAPNTQTQKQNTPRSPWIGMRTRTVDQNVMEALGLPMKFGVLVMEVFDLSPCQKAGLEAGDVIMRVDKRSVKNEKMLWKRLNKKTVGDKIKLSVYRDGTKMNFTCKLSVRPTGIGIPKFVKPPEFEFPEIPAAFLQAQPIARTIPGSSAPIASNGRLPSPREQNAAGKKFIEGHWLGLEVIPLTAELASQYQIPKGETGILVDEVTLEAAESGILAGDMVQSVGGFTTPDLRAFFEATQQEQVMEGKQTDVGISRRGKRMSFIMEARNTTMLGFAQMEAAQPIQPGALRPHRYMGSCTNCHIFMRTGGQLATDAGDILPNPPPITKNAQAPHRYRGLCATCHTVR